MNIKYKPNLAAGIGSAVSGLAVLFLIQGQIEAESKSKYGITSRTIPYAMAVLLIVCGLLLIYQSLVRKNDTVKVLDVKKELKALLYVIILVIYGFLFRINFTVSLVFLGVSTLIIMKNRKLLYYIIIIILAISLYFLFDKWLNMTLPGGV